MRERVCVLYDGGLGNQMFQWAFSRYLEKQGLTVQADLWKFGPGREPRFQLLSLFPGLRLARKLRLRLALLQWLVWLMERSWLLRPLARESKRWMHRWEDSLCHGGSAIRESDWASVQSEPYVAVSRPIYVGYWQSWRFAEQVKETLRNDFRFPPVIGTSALGWLRTISDGPSVGVHVRMGDYLDPENVALYGNICTANYYRTAMEVLGTRLGAVRFYVFSNDPAAAKVFLAKVVPAEGAFFLDNGLRSNWEDLVLLSSCQHQIIANSTFSWWAAWLNPNPRKVVITPERWVNDIPKRVAAISTEAIPPEWIRVPS